MSTLITALMVASVMAGVILGAFGHSIATARRAQRLSDREIELDVRVLTTYGAIERPRAMGTSIVKPRDPDPNARTITRPAHVDRQRPGHRFLSEFYPTLSGAARSLSEPVTVVQVPGKPEDTRELASMLMGGTDRRTGRHAANRDEWAS